jgi:hypothetical protein
MKVLAKYNCLSKIVLDNFITINDFFNSNNYESKVAGLEKFIINKYPELFKRSE